MPLLSFDGQGSSHGTGVLRVDKLITVCLFKRESNKFLSNSLDTTAYSPVESTTCGTPVGLVKIGEGRSPKSILEFMREFLNNS